MRFKDTLISVGFAFVTVTLLQRFVFDRFFPSSTATQGQSFVAEQTQKPLKVEVDFADSQYTKRPQLTEVITPLRYLQFSTQGATIDRLEFTKIPNGSSESIVTVFPASDENKEDRLFLIALDEKTPFAFDLIDQQETEDNVILTYQALSGKTIVRKMFVVHKNTYQIDVELTIVPDEKSGKPVAPRIFVPGPCMPELGADDLSAGLVDIKGSVQKIYKNKLDTQTTWVKPNFFGLENRYFVHTLVKDGQHFIERAYYKASSHDGRLITILEGPAVSQQTTWKMSFYCGPKEESAMMLVDNRLAQTLDYYGLLAPISRLMLYILKMIYEYVHNFGFAIILLTFLVRLLLVPLTFRSEQALRQGQELDKKLAQARQRYKDDKDALARENAEIMKKHALQPMLGCLPQLLQIPAFLALSRVLSNAIELYRAPFFGWIHDLSMKDPFYILPILIVATMLFQAAVGDAKQRSTLIFVAIIFGAVSTSFSAGLSLYFFVSTLLGVLQTWIQGKIRTRVA